MSFHSTPSSIWAGVSPVSSANLACPEFGLDERPGLGLLDQLPPVLGSAGGEEPLPVQLRIGAVNDRGVPHERVVLAPVRDHGAAQIAQLRHALTLGLAHPPYLPPQHPFSLLRQAPDIRKQALAVDTTRPARRRGRALTATGGVCSVGDRADPRW